MKAHENNREELINSFVDGELSPRQRTEVKRLAAHDESVAKEIRQLNNCRNLLRSLPREEPPEEIVENLRTLLERRSLLDKEALPTVERNGRVVFLRQLRSAAAVLVLVGGLSYIVFNILSPIHEGGSTVARHTELNPLDTKTGGGAVVAKDMQAVYELHINKETDLASELDRVVASQGLESSVSRHQVDGQQAYSIRCKKQAMGQVLAGLQGVWGAVNQSQLVLTGGDQSDKVIVKRAAPSLVARVLDQKTQSETFNLARKVVANRQDNLLPNSDMPPIAKPVLTSSETPDANVLTMSGEGDAEITFVLINE